MKRLIGACLLSASALGCVAQSQPVDDFDEATEIGKADTARRLIAHSSSIQWIHEIGVTFDEDVGAHSFDFKIGSPERVSIFTQLFSGSRGPEVDTVIYLYRKGARGWGRYIAKNDNTSEGTLWSRIDKDLEEGEYRIVVRARNETVMGAIGLNMTCADGVCDERDPRIPVVEPMEPGTGDPDSPTSGRVSLRIPLLVEGGDATLFSQYNDALTRAHLPTFPDYVTASSEDEDPSAEFERLAELASRDDVMAVTEDAELMMYNDPSALLLDEADEWSLCYTGNGTALPDFMQSFGDSAFSDMFSVWGWRARNKSAYGEWHEPTTESGIHDEWFDFDPESGAVFLVYSVDDDGNEQTLTIPRCH